VKHCHLKALRRRTPAYKFDSKIPQCMFRQSVSLCQRFGQLCTAHAQKLSFQNFRSKFRHFRWNRRLRFPIWYGYFGDRWTFTMWLLSWQPVAVEPTYRLADGSGTVVAAACNLPSRAGVDHPRTLSPNRWGLRVVKGPPLSLCKEALKGLYSSRKAADLDVEVVSD